MPDGSAGHRPPGGGNLIIQVRPHFYFEIQLSDGSWSRWHFKGPDPEDPRLLIFSTRDHRTLVLDRLRPCTLIDGLRLSSARTKRNALCVHSTPAARLRFRFTQP
jgi:hypothetical protein